MESEQPTQPMPPPSPSPRRLTRSRTDRVLGGVCGGIARALGVDAMVVRILAVALLFAGGISLIAYVAMLVLVPEEAEGAEQPPPPRDTNAAMVVLVAVGLIVLAPVLLGGGLVLAGLLFPVAFIALAGLVTWWLVSGEPFGGDAVAIIRRSALGLLVLAGSALLFGAGFMGAGIGGGTAAAGGVIAAGAVLVVGAFVGRVRWVILPAMSLALGVGIVAAAGLSLEGGYGERDYRPTSAASVNDRYELAAGELVLDLRRADLPRGDTPVKLQLGMGQATLVVPKDVCVASKAEVGAGAVDVFGDTNGGVNLDWDDQPEPDRRGRRLVVDADIGFGALLVRHDRRDLDRGHSRAERSEPFGDYRGPGNTGCSGA